MVLFPRDPCDPRCRLFFVWFAVEKLVWDGMEALARAAGKGLPALPVSVADGFEAEADDAVE